MSEIGFAVRKGWMSRLVVGFWWYTVTPRRAWNSRRRRQSRLAS
jgi:hypothetical protein